MGCHQNRKVVDCQASIMQKSRKDEPSLQKLQINQKVYSGRGFLELLIHPSKIHSSPLSF